MQQLGLPVLLDAKMRLSNFIGVKNAQILAFVDALFSQQNSSVVVLSGDKSSGKTHFLQGCTFVAMEAQLNAVYIDAEEEIPKGLIADLSASDWVCIDNIECLDNAQQQELFDLYNQIKHTQTKLIMSINKLPDNFLKDLETRLSLAVNYTLETLTDQQKISILQSKMKDKNINIDAKIYTYLFKYYSRDLSELLMVIDQLDQASLQQKNSITIPLIKQVLLNAV
ncbi:DnaA regulatory inactivator Hda (Homologous to DnaA) [uncultured Candidatus Thioglobus sp.]|nr:DnaA regulatory inactivator Hda (Homologous to DnaA) [uncultured Candidatus Thioglobus sp.]